jgi:SAM-dependent methyltransferase
MAEAGSPTHLAGTDTTGHATLEALAQAPRFNRWMFERLRPWTGRRIVELGSGSGNLSTFLVPLGPVLLSDPDPAHVRVLRSRWAGASSVAVERIDMTRAGDLERVLAFGPDTVVFLNVLEHVADDLGALKLLHRHVPGACTVIALVPSGPRLFSAFDRALGHHRRYAKGALEETFRLAGFEVVHSEPFHKAGRLPWFIQMTLGGARSLPALELRLYDRAVPLLRVLDRLLPGPVLSTIVVARKP